MNPIREFYLEVKRIDYDVQLVIAKHKLWKDGGTANDDFIPDLQRAFGDGGERDLKGDAIRSTNDPDIRRRIEEVQKALRHYVMQAYVGGGNYDWRKASFDLNTALEALEPFTRDPEQPEWVTRKQIHKILERLLPSAPEIKTLQHLPGFSKHQGKKDHLADYQKLLPHLRKKWPEIQWPSQLSNWEQA